MHDDVRFQGTGRLAASRGSPRLGTTPVVKGLTTLETLGPFGTVVALYPSETQHPDPDSTPNTQTQTQHPTPRPRLNTQTQHPDPDSTPKPPKTPDRPGELDSPGLSVCLVTGKDSVQGAAPAKSNNHRAAIRPVARSTVALEPLTLGLAHGQPETGGAGRETLQRRGGPSLLVVRSTVDREWT